VEQQCDGNLKEEQVSYKQWYPLKGMMCTHKLHRQGVSEEETRHPTMCYVDLKIEPEGGVATGVPIQQDDQDADAEDGAEIGEDGGLAIPFAPLQKQLSNKTSRMPGAEDSTLIGSEAEGLANPFAPLQPQVGSITG
jgi:hypothetical protein